MRKEFSNLKGQNFIIFLYSLSLFINPYLALTWSTFPVPGISSILELSKWIGLLIGIYLVVRKKRIRIRLIDITIIVLSVLFVVLITCCTYKTRSPFAIGYWKIIVDLAILVFIGREERKRIYIYIKQIFILLTFPGMIFFILFLAGIKIPTIVFDSPNVLKTLSSKYYILSPLGIIDYSKWSPLQNRPCGFFDEPGYIGTVAVLLLSVELYSDKKILSKSNIMLFVVGVLSTSFAFYVLLFIVLMLYSFRKGAMKFGIIMLLVLAMYIIFGSLDLSKYHYLSSIQSRFRISGNVLAGDNRTSEGFEDAFAQFLADGGVPLLFGNGIESRSGDTVLGGSCSYKTLIYDYGIIGSCCLLAILILIYYKQFLNKWSMIPFFAFLLSMYQRPYVFTTFYLAILMCGLEEGDNTSDYCASIMNNLVSS